MSYHGSGYGLVHHGYGYGYDHYYSQMMMMIQQKNEDLYQIHGSINCC